MLVGSRLLLRGSALGGARCASTSTTCRAPLAAVLAGPTRQGNGTLGSPLPVPKESPGGRLSAATTKFLDRQFSSGGAQGLVRGYKGQCHCGKVQFKVAGKPAWTAACHCSICRVTHSAPYAELCGYGNDDVAVTKGEEHLSMYNCNGKSQEDRYFCRKCGSKVYSKLNHLDCKAVHLQNLTSPHHGADGQIDKDFQMGCHIFYGSGSAKNFDKLPKYDTLPEAFGGDGKELKADFREPEFQHSFGSASGQCHCGEVHFEVEGKPAWTAACHCSICRLTHSAPYAELCGFGDDAVKITKGEASLDMYNCNGKSQEDRYFCRKCGSKVYSKLNHLGCKAIHLQTLKIPNHGAGGKIHKDFAMGCHILYGSGTISNFDKLQKFDTLPEAFGGDGKELPNDFHDTR